MLITEIIYKNSENQWYYSELYIDVYFINILKMKCIVFLHIEENITKYLSLEHQFYY